MARFRYPDPLEPPPYPVNPSSSTPVAPSREDDREPEEASDEGAAQEPGDQATP